MFLEQLACSLQEPGWAIRTLFFKYGGICVLITGWCFWSWSAHRGKQLLCAHARACTHTHTHHCCKPFFWLKQLPKDLKDDYLFFPFIFLFFLFWEPHIKDEDIPKQAHIQEKLETHLGIPGKGAGSEKTWGHLKFTPKHRDDILAIKNRMWFHSV